MRMLIVNGRSDTLPQLFEYENQAQSKSIDFRAKHKPNSAILCIASLESIVRLFDSNHSFTTLCFRSENSSLHTVHLFRSTCRIPVYEIIYPKSVCKIITQNHKPESIPTRTRRQKTKKKRTQGASARSLLNLESALSLLALHSTCGLGYPNFSNSLLLNLSCGANTAFPFTSLNSGTHLRM